MKNANSLASFLTGTVSLGLALFLVLANAPIEGRYSPSVVVRSAVSAPDERPLVDGPVLEVSPKANVDVDAESRAILAITSIAFVAFSTYFATAADRKAEATLGYASGLLATTSSVSLLTPVAGLGYVLALAVYFFVRQKPQTAA